MSVRWLPWAVLSAATLLSVLVGLAGVHQLRTPSPPDSPNEVVERIEAAGISCGGVTTAEDDEHSTFVCGEPPDAVFVTYERTPVAGASGSYVPLTSLGAEPAALSGVRFRVLGPYDTLARLQTELGGRIDRW